MMGIALARDPLLRVPMTTGLEMAEREIFTQTNAERVKIGLKPLIFDPRLSAAARLHALEMAQKNYFSHTSPTKGLQTPTDRIHAAGNLDWGAGENIALNEEPAAKVGATLMRQWLNSPPHRASILDKTYTHIGIGVYRDAAGRSYGVQNFVARTTAVALTVNTRVLDSQTLELRGAVTGNREVALFSGSDFLGAVQTDASGQFVYGVPFAASRAYQLGARPKGAATDYLIGATTRSPAAFKAGALSIAAQAGSGFKNLSATLNAKRQNSQVLELRLSNPKNVLVLSGLQEARVPIRGDTAQITCAVGAQRLPIKLALSSGNRYAYTHRFVLDCATGNIIAGAEQ
jgi:hypothetical protein